MKRRAFLARVTAALASAATVGGSLGCGAGGLDVAAAPGQLALLSALGAEAVRDLGSRYARAAPAEAEPSALRDAITADVRALRGVPWNTPPSFAALVANDFARGRTIVLDGWLLSRNEARHYALFALSAPAV